MKKIISYFFVVCLSFFLIQSCGEDEPIDKVPDTQKPAKVTEKQKSSEDTSTVETKEVKEKPVKKEEKKTSGLPESYVVQPGETLSYIADKIYNDSSLWFYIFSENEYQIDSWNKIFPGQELKLPKLSEEKNM